MPQDQPNEPSEIQINKAHYGNLAIMAKYIDDFNMQWWSPVSTILSNLNSYFVLSQFSPLAIWGLGLSAIKIMQHTITSVMQHFPIPNAMAEEISLAKPYLLQLGLPIIDKQTIALPNAANLKLGQQLTNALWAYFAYTAFSDLLISIGTRIYHCFRSPKQSATASTLPRHWFFTTVEKFCSSFVSIYSLIALCAAGADYVANIDALLTQINGPGGIQHNKLACTHTLVQAGPLPFYAVFFRNCLPLALQFLLSSPIRPYAAVMTAFLVASPLIAGIFAVNSILERYCKHRQALYNNLELPLLETADTHPEMQPTTNSFSNQLHQLASPTKQTTVHPQSWLTQLIEKLKRIILEASHLTSASVPLIALTDLIALFLWQVPVLAQDNSCVNYRQVLASTTACTGSYYNASTHARLIFNASNPQHKVCNKAITVKAPYLPTEHLPFSLPCGNSVTQGPLNIIGIEVGFIYTTLYALPLTFIVGCFKGLYQEFVKPRSQRPKESHSPSPSTLGSIIFSMTLKISQPIIYLSYIGFLAYNQPRVSSLTGDFNIWSFLGSYLAHMLTTLITPSSSTASMSKATNTTLDPAELFTQRQSLLTWFNWTKMIYLICGLYTVVPVALWLLSQCGRIPSSASNQSDEVMPESKDAYGEDIHTSGHSSETKKPTPDAKLSSNVQQVPNSPPKATIGFYPHSL